jgi:hypothetical protein
MAIKTVNNIEKTIQKYFETFIIETVNGIQIKTLPTKDKVPIVEQYGYDESLDIFEIIFKKCDQNDIIKKVKDFIIFIESKKGELLAIQIVEFKKHRIEKIKVTVNASINNEIQDLQMELSANQNIDISNTIIEKRKLEFLNDVIKNNLDEMRRNKISSESVI